MPIVNGRVHIEHSRLATHHRVAFGVGIGIAVIVVAIGWAVTVGSQIKTFARNTLEGAQTAGDTFDLVQQKTTDAFAPVGGAVDQAKQAFVDLVKDANQKKEAAEAVASLVKDQLIQDAQAETLPEAKPKTP